jgi:FliI/YscN family ATPase
VILRGRVERVERGSVVARLPRVAIGDAVCVGGTSAEVRRVQRGCATLSLHGPLEGVACGADVVVDRAAAEMPLGTCLLGRAIDARGVPIDGKRAPCGPRIAPDAPAPFRRAAIVEPFWTGVRCIDALLTLGAGARAGIFGAPGCGKSTLLEMLVQGSEADAVVVGLVGERGREAHGWIQRCDARTSVVCATSERPAAERWRAARVAFAQAHALRSRGLHVLLVLDSLARAAMALRELALAGGEPPGRGGYPPSVFAQLARLVEIAGATANGTMTLVSTVLDDGDERDPVSDAARSLLDGHIQLSAALVRAGRFPAVDVPSSASRTMDAVVPPEHARAARAVRSAVSLLARSEDARSLGITPQGAAAEAALACEAEIEALLRQDREACPPRDTPLRLLALAERLEAHALGHAAFTPR